MPVIESWKIYREKLSGWQEHYMERLLQSYKELIESPGNASELFGKLEELEGFSRDLIDGVKFILSRR